MNASALWDLAEVFIQSTPDILAITALCRKPAYKRMLFFGCNSREDTRRAVEDLLNGKNRPTAFFTSNNLATRYVFAALLHLGVKVPVDVALAGFDDFELAELTSPPLTVVRQPAQEMGRVAASLLFERIERGELPQTGTRIALPVEIVLRRSCGCKHRTAVRNEISSMTVALPHATRSRLA